MKLKFLLPFLFTVLLILFFTAQLFIGPKEAFEKSPLLGKQIPDFTLAALEGGSLSSADLKGKYSVVNIFASWCLSCAAEQPALKKLTEETRVPIYGIAWKDQDAKTKEWLVKNGNHFAKVGTDHNGKAAIAFGITGAPETFVVNPKGIIIFRQAGPLDNETTAKLIVILRELNK